MLPILALPLPQSQRDRVLEDFEAARQDARLTKDQIAHVYGTTREQLYQQLRGVGGAHLSLTRLYLMAQDEDGRRFLRAYIQNLTTSWGIPEIAIALKLWLLFKDLNMREQFLGLINSVQKKRMAKCDLHEQQEERSA